MNSINLTCESTAYFNANGPGFKSCQEQQLIITRFPERVINIFTVYSGHLSIFIKWVCEVTQQIDAKSPKIIKRVVNIMFKE